MMAPNRGRYEAIYFDRLLHDDRFRQLNAAQRWLWVVIRATVGRFGIARIPLTVPVLADASGLDEQEVVDGLGALARDGWIRRDGTLLWMVRALAFVPDLNPGLPTHRAALLRHIGSLGSSPLVAAFWKEYPEWRGASSLPASLGDSLTDSHSLAYSASASASPSESASPSPSPNGGVDYTRGLVVVANQAITAAFGEQTQPLRASAGTSHEAARTAREAGVPIPFAAAILARWAATAKGKPPRSLGYFRDMLCEAWEDEGERWRAQATPTTAAAPPRAGVRRGKGQAGKATGDAIDRAFDQLDKGG